MHTCMSPYLIGLIELRVKTVSAKQSIRLPDKRLTFDFSVRELCGIIADVERFGKGEEMRGTRRFLGDVSQPREKLI